MDPRWLFPCLAVGFAVAAAWRWRRTRQWRGAVQTWSLMAAIFAAVSLWLRFAG